ncbi:MAG: hypothetical protein QGH59_07550, partial [Gemmatimonadota bacterium]|nr:hypothetical protein [Gemmatimonadota bacterium]
DPAADGAPDADIWFRRSDAEAVRSILRECPEGHLPLKMLRRAGRKTSRISSLCSDNPAGFLSSEYQQRFRSATGMQHSVITHLGTEPGESLGRITYLRAAGTSDFREESVRILRAIRPAFSDAARRILSNRWKRPHQEMALICHSGKLLWQSNGFRFLWGTMDDERLGGRPLDARDLRTGSVVCRALARHLDHLNAPEQPPPLRPYRARRPYRNGRGALDASIAQASGLMLGCNRDILRLTLTRDRPAGRATVPGTLPAAWVESRVF